MEPSDLERVKSLLASGYVESAQHALQDLLRANPKDLQAWSLYVKSWSDPQKRIKALELCLKFNPGNADAERALVNLRNKLNAPIQPPQPAASQPKPTPPIQKETTSDWLRDSNASSGNAQDKNVAYNVFASPPQNDPPQPAWAADFSNPQQRLTKEEIDRQAREMEEGRRKVRMDIGRPMAWYEVWFTALTNPNADAYDALKMNPYNLPSRTYIWLIISGMISGVILALAFGLNPQFSQILNMMEVDFPGISQSFRALLFCLIPLSGIMYLINTAIRVGIQHLVAMVMGGEGKYSDLMYLVSAYSAPMTIATSVLSLIPFIGSCLITPLGFYSIYLNVQAIQSAHNFNALKAFGVIISIFLLNLMFICVIAYVAFPYIAPYLPTQTTF